MPPNIPSYSLYTSTRKLDPAAIIEYVRDYIREFSLKALP
jgi:hypothetical protein